MKDAPPVTTTSPSVRLKTDGRRSSDWGIRDKFYRAPMSSPEAFWGKGEWPGFALVLSESEYNLINFGMSAILSA
jgi:hypothetical protein